MYKQVLRSSCFGQNAVVAFRRISWYHLIENLAGLLAGLDRREVLEIVEVGSPTDGACGLDVNGMSWIAFN